MAAVEKVDGTGAVEGGPAAAAAQPRRPRSAKGARTRGRILAAATELMYRRGAGPTTLDEIKASAEVSSSQVYHYFADKQELVRAVVAHQAGLLVDAQRGEDLSTLDGLRRWGSRVVERERVRGHRGGPATDLVGGELGETDVQGRAEAAEGFRRWAAVIAEGLQAMRAAGGLPASTDPDALAVAVLATVQGGLLLSRVQQDLTPLRSAVGAAVRLVELLGQTSPDAPP